MFWVKLDRDLLGGERRPRFEFTTSQDVVCHVSLLLSSFSLLREHERIFGLMKNELSKFDYAEKPYQIRCSPLAKGLKIICVVLSWTSYHILCSIYFLSLVWVYYFCESFKNYMDSGLLFSCKLFAWSLFLLCCYKDIWMRNSFVSVFIEAFLLAVYLFDMIFGEHLNYDYDFIYKLQVCSFCFLTTLWALDQEYM